MGLGRLFPRAEAGPRADRCPAGQGQRGQEAEGLISIDPRVAFHTFGCKLNQYETEALASSFRAAGFAVTRGEEADVHVVNTCTVTSRADHKARTLVRALSRANPKCAVLVTGCSAQTEGEALAGLGDNIVIVPQSEKARILEVPRVLLAALAAGETPLGRARELLAPVPGHEGVPDRSGPGGQARPPRPAGPFDLVAATTTFHTRAFLKIQDGCDCRCAYCRVPQARGPSASLELEEVLRRALELEELGRREIVLTGVNICSWSSTGAGLPKLLQRLLASSRTARFRLSSLEPECLSEDLAGILRSPRICPHFHIPVQSGSDPVLALMKRRYRSAQVRDGVRRLQGAKDDPFIAADIITGFPGESTDDHERTLALVEDLGFAALHVFPFSPRPGTEAAVMKPVIPERIRRERASALGALSRKLSADYVRRWAGREVAVLLQSNVQRRWRGVSENYLLVELEGLPLVAAAQGSVVRSRVIGALEPGGRLVRAEFLSQGA